MDASSSSSELTSSVTGQHSLPACEFKNVNFFYQNSNVPALKDINLIVNRGEFILLVGQSGSGKSTLIKCINGLIPHKSKHATLHGEILLFGKNTNKLKIRDISQKVGTVFQNPDEQFFSLNVDAELAFGPENLGVSPEEIGLRIKDAKNWVEMEGLGKKQIFMLSGGQKQRVAIGSILTMRPEIIILDEPTSDLDPQGTEEVMHIIKRISSETGATIILAEHKLEDVAQHADRVILMQNGRIVVNAPPRKAFKEYKRFEKEGVSIPQVCQIGIFLQQLGYQIPQIPLNVDECVDSLKNLSPVRIKIPGKEKDLVDLGSPVLQILDLWHVYRDGTIAAKDVSFRLYPGEFVGMIGQNGAGKSTILSHIIGLLRPSRGKILIKENDVANYSVGRLAETVGYVYQNPDLMLFTNKVISEIEFAPKNAKISNYHILVALSKDIKLSIASIKDEQMVSSIKVIYQYFLSKLNTLTQFNSISTSSTRSKRTISNEALKNQSLFLSTILDDLNISIDSIDSIINEITTETEEIKVLRLSKAVESILLFSETREIMSNEFMSENVLKIIQKLNAKLANLSVIEPYRSQVAIKDLKIFELKKQALDPEEIMTITNLEKSEAERLLQNLPKFITGCALHEVDAIQERIEEGLHTIELEPLAHRHPHALSRGQRHRVAVASVLAMHPKLLILDEPTNGQDYGHTEALMKLVTKISKKGTTVVIISHDMKLIAKYCNRIIVLRKGEILLDGPTKAVFNRPDLLESTNLQPSKVTLVAQKLNQIQDTVLTVEEFGEYYKK